MSAVVAGVVLATPAAAIADGAVVEIHDYQYHAADVSVQAGQAVTWTNRETAAHDVASTAGPVAFASPELGEGESFTFTFTQPGGYAYLCTLHPDMVGTVTVTPAPATTAPPTTAAALPAGPTEATAPPGEAPPTTVAVVAAPVSGDGAVAAAAVSVASVERDDLGTAARPYLVLLAVVAATLVGTLLLFGAGRRDRAAD